MSSGAKIAHMKTRTDKFRPSVINPAEFEFIGYHYLGSSDEAWEALCGEMTEGAEALEAHQAAHPGYTVAGHKWPGQCDCCGARYLYGATFHTAATNTYISIGGTCASKMSLGDPAAMKKFREQITAHKMHAASVAKARAYLTTVGLGAMLDLFLTPPGKSNTVLEYHADPHNDVMAPKMQEFPERTLVDMCSSIIRWGSELSEKQRAFAAKLLQQIADRPRLLAERAARDADRAPIPAFIKRATIEGTIIAAKVVEGDYGTSIKITVEHADGWKVWGTASAELTEAVSELSDKSWLPEAERAALLKGKRVRFDAAIVVSDNDSKFGFFKRPTKASLLDSPCSSESLPA